MRRPRRLAVSLQPTLVGSHVAILALPVAVLLATGAWSRELLHQRQEELAREAALIALMVEGELHPELTTEGPSATEGEGYGVPGGEHAVGLPTSRRTGTDVDPTLATLAPTLTSRLVRAFHATHAGVRIVDTNGVVLATSGPRLGESLADLPEVQEALHGGSSVAVRTEMPPPLVVPRADDRKAEPLTWAYATVPIAPRGRVVGAVLLTRPTRGVLDAAHDMRHDLGAGVLVALGFTVSMATWLGWRLSRSLRRVARVAHDLADDPTPGSPAVETALATLADTRVSEVRAIAQAFARLVERLDQRLRYNQEFAGNVAHEFKTPLATLRGTIDLLTDDLLDDETAMPAEQRALFLTNARTDLDRLDRMVSGLLALARAETPPVRARVALAEILEDLRDRHPGLTVIGTPPDVEGDEAQLETALLNLLENARLHGRPPVVLRADERVRADGGREVVIEVEDAGSGISPANLPRIFERFFTTSAGRTGTGLGLPLVHAIVRAHGGEVEVESAPGRTVFRVRLPRGPRSDAAPSVP